MTQELRLQDWLESLPAEAAALDGNGAILAVNESWRRFARQTGFRGEQRGVGESYLALCHSVSPEDDYAGTARGIEAVLSGTAPDFELEYGHEVAGRTRWYRLTVTPLRTPHGAEALVMHFDMTSAHRAGEELRGAEAVGRLAGGVAHDFNNLLTAILSYCDLLEAESSEPASGMVREIQHAARQAAALTKQLLALGRRQILQLAILDLNEVVRGLDATLRDVAGEKVKVTHDLAESPTRVYADSGQIEQVLVNLAANACDAMPAGGQLTIRTAIRPSEAGRSTVTLVVSDTGVGMDQDTQARLFEPFFTTRPPGERRGLGLATSHGIVHQLGGSIDVESTKGAGSTFTVCLPLESRRTPRSVAPTPDRPGSDVAATATVLIVDDEDNVRDAVSKILTRVGYTVVSAGGGEEALRRMRALSKPVDLVLTDVVMNGVSGVEMASMAQTENPSMKVLFMSGYSESEVLRHGVQTRTMKLLRKPFTMEELIQAVRESLRMSQ